MVPIGEAEDSDKKKEGERGQGRKSVLWGNSTVREDKRDSEERKVSARGREYIEDE